MTLCCALPPLPAPVCCVVDILPFAVIMRDPHCIAITATTMPCPLLPTAPSYGYSPFTPCIIATCGSLFLCYLCSTRTCAAHDIYPTLLPWFLHFITFYTYLDLLLDYTGYTYHILALTLPVRTHYLCPLLSLVPLTLTVYLPHPSILICMWTQLPSTDILYYYSVF